MKQKLTVLAALCALFVLIFASAPAIDAAAWGLRLCGELLVPTLFPFFVVSGLLRRTGFPALAGQRLGPLARRLFGVSGQGLTALLLGLTGGCPLGAAYLAEMEEQGLISPREAERLLGFCNNSGPAFLIGTIGTGIFGSASAGLLLYAAHALAALTAGLLLRGKACAAAKPAPVLHAEPFSRALAEAVREAVPAVLNVCGFAVVFNVFTGVLEAKGLLGAAAELLRHFTGLDPAVVRPLLIGFWELGGGVGAMRGLPLTPGTLALAGALVGWGGVSVLFQTQAVLADREIKSSLHLAGRLLSAALGALFSFLLGALLL